MDDSAQKEAKEGGKKLNSLYIYGMAIAIIALIVVVALAASSMAGATVVNGDNVSVYYTGRFTNGTVFNTNVGGAPFNFTVGKNQVIQGFNNAVLGMKVGQNKTITIPPNEAYGEFNQSLVIPVPLKYFANTTVKVGMIVSSPNGPQGEVIAVNNTTAMVNFNPPLAGKTLVFTIKLVSIKK
ncbi:MAG: FKBP-type peptidyl-prolyl cis-trans isomerase [Candidatus Micrarchaeia archaeon]